MTEDSGIDDPVTFRPRLLRIMVIVAAVGLLALTAVGWFALPVPIRVLFTLSQRLTLLAVLALLIFVIAAAASSYVRADAAGLKLRNGLRTYEVPWARVHKIVLRRGDPWALLLLKPADGSQFRVDLDAERRILMGIQASDGAAAESAVEELRRRQGVAAAR
jgi:hypothetical protein